MAAKDDDNLADYNAFKAEIRKEFGELTVAELTQTWMMIGEYLLELTTRRNDAPLTTCHLPKTHEFAFYAKGPMADWWANKMKEILSRTGGRQTEMEL
jgi:hypothetical protein